MDSALITTDPRVLATEPEGQFFDRKSSRIEPQHLAKLISAFANASGGRVAIGIEDDGTLSGFAIEKATTIETLERTHILHCTPSPVVTSFRIPIHNRTGKDDNLLILDVAPSSNHVIEISDTHKAYLRVNDSSRELNNEGRKALEYDKHQRSFEDEPVQGSSIEDIDETSFARYKEILKTKSTTEQVLRSRDFMVNDNLTNAGVLLFAAHPTKYLLQARVRVLRFDGDRMTTGRNLNIVKDQTFDGPLPTQIEGAKTLISSMLRDFSFLSDDGTFQTIPEYPEFSWFEGLINAVSHRDYAFRGDHIRVSMFEDRLEIFSPGSLPNLVTLKNMQTTRYSRNPRIARTFGEFGWVRELNEGVKRIYSDMQAFFLKEPVYSEPNQASVLLRLENSIASRQLRKNDSFNDLFSAEILSSLNDVELAALRLAYDTGKVTVKQLREVTGRGTRAVRVALRRLADSKYLMWHGVNLSDPHQYYALK